MKKKTEPEMEHPSQDTTNRFSADQILRRHGYKIASRVNGHMPLWYDPEGKVINQQDALRRLICD